MAYNASTLGELERARARGQKPDGFVVVGNRHAEQWALRNRFFFVEEADCEDDLTAFAGIDVLVLSPNIELAQRIAMNARYVTWRNGVTRFL